MFRVRGLRAAAGTADDVVAKSLTLWPAKENNENGAQEMTLSGYAVCSLELIYSRRLFSFEGSSTITYFVQVHFSLQFLATQGPGARDLTSC